MIDTVTGADVVGVVEKYGLDSFQPGWFLSEIEGACRGSYNLRCIDLDPFIRGAVDALKAGDNWAEEFDYTDQPDMRDYNVNVKMHVCVWELLEELEEDYDLDNFVNMYFKWKAQTGNTEHESFIDWLSEFSVFDIYRGVQVTLVNTVLELRAGWLSDADFEE